MSDLFDQDDPAAPAKRERLQALGWWPIMQDPRRWGWRSPSGETFTEARAFEWLDQAGETK